MPLSKCPRCKKIFDKNQSLVCANCQKDEDSDYDKIRSVIERIPNLKADQVAQEAEVSIQCVLRMLDDGLISNASLADVRCGRCGGPAISLSKKLCQPCLDKLNAEVARQQMRLKSEIKKDARPVSGENITTRREYEEKRRI